MRRNKLTTSVLARATLLAAVAIAWRVAAAEDAGSRYAKLLADSESFARYNAQIEQQLQSQQLEMESIQQQLAGLDVISAEFSPLLTRMFERLEEFVATDLPFLDPVSDRLQRIARLRVLMDAEGATVAEKYRRLLEAYQIELEYGRTMAVYKAPLPDGRQAEYVRVGRVSLMYRTVDGSETGYWNTERRSWVTDNNYAAEVLAALRIARKEIAPDLVTVPVPAPEGGGR